MSAEESGFDRGTHRPTTKLEIDGRLAALVGLPLCYANRAVDMATFGFGRLIEREGRRGREEVAEYRLHIQETWRITRDGTGAARLRRLALPAARLLHRLSGLRGARRAPEPAGRPPRRLVAHGPAGHTVRETHGTSAGDLTIVFADGCVLETFVNQASATDDDERDSESWRLLPPSMTGEEPHFVVTARGIER